jgi:UDP-N-acetylmuramoyl-L-alanyl-D-glutamate--2,6-diaminopimelate ligase
MERVDAGQDFTVLVDYAHTPDALGNALGAARELARRRRPRDRGVRMRRRSRSRQASTDGRDRSRLADRTYVTTDNSRSEEPAAIIGEIVAGIPTAPESTGGDVIIEADRAAAIRAAIDAARTGDVVIVAGKGHETGQTAHGETMPFDDRRIARTELAGRS